MKKNRNLLAGPAKFIEVTEATWHEDGKVFELAAIVNGTCLARCNIAQEQDVRKIIALLKIFGVSSKWFKPGVPEQPRWLQGGSYE